MICSKCGGENPAGASVCGSCGEPLTPEKPTGGKLPGGSKAVSLAVVIGGVVLAIALLVWIFSLIFGGGAKGAALKYLKAGNSKTGGKTIVNLLPKAYLEEQLDKNDDYDDKKDMIEAVNERLEESWDNAKETKRKTSYKVVDVIKKKDMGATALDDLKDLYEEKYDVKVSDAANVYVYIKTKDEDGKWGGFSSVPMVKIGGKWCLDVTANYFDSTLISGF